MEDQPADISDALVQKQKSLSAKLLTHVDLYQSRLTTADTAATSSSTAPDQTAQRKVISNLQKVRKVILEEIEELEAFLNHYDESTTTNNGDSRQEFRNSSMFVELVPIRKDLATAKEIFAETDTKASQNIPALRWSQITTNETSAAIERRETSSPTPRDENPSREEVVGSTQKTTTDVSASSSTDPSTIEVVEGLLKDGSPSSVDLAAALLTKEASLLTSSIGLEQFWWRWAKRFESLGMLSALALSFPTLSWTSSGATSGAAEDDVDVLAVRDLRLYELIFNQLLVVPEKVHLISPFLDRYRPVVNVDKMATPLLRKDINSSIQPRTPTSLSNPATVQEGRLMVLKHTLQQLVNCEASVPDTSSSSAASLHHLRAKSSSFVLV